LTNIFVNAFSPEFRSIRVREVSGDQRAESAEELVASEPRRSLNVCEMRAQAPPHAASALRRLGTAYRTSVQTPWNTRRLAMRTTFRSLICAAIVLSTLWTCAPAARADETTDYINQIYQDQQNLNDYLNSIQETQDYINNINSSVQETQNYINSINASVQQTQDYIDSISQNN
jgi:hypothetical protein